MKHYSYHIGECVIKDIIDDKVSHRIDSNHKLEQHKLKQYYSKYTNSIINRIITSELTQSSPKPNHIPKIHQQLLSPSQQKTIQIRKNSKSNRYLIKKKSSLPMQFISNYQNKNLQKTQMGFISLHQKHSQLIQFNNTQRQIQKIRQRRGRLYFKEVRNQVKYKELKKYGKYPTTFGFDQQEIIIKQQKPIKKNCFNLKNGIICQEIVKSDVKTIHLQSSLHLRLKQLMFEKKVQYDQPKTNKQQINEKNSTFNCKKYKKLLSQIKQSQKKI